MLDPAAIPRVFAELEALEFLTESGQRYVFRAKLAGREIVLKIFKAGQEQERIDREIRAVASLDCDYVPAVIDSGKRTINGTIYPYLIEAFVDGQSYRAILQRRPIQSLDVVVRLGEDLLSACCDFEAQAMVHRDIKPENLIVAPDGKLWILDFGIVRLLSLTSATHSQQRFGLFTAGYGAPEQVRNIKSRIDIKADLFSVGVVLYESLNGFNPYRQGMVSDLDIIQHVCNRDLPPLELPGDPQNEISELISALTARFPSRRPPTAQDALSWWREAATRISKEV